MEWYANGPLGLEQGLTLRAPPNARAGSSGDLGLSFALSGAAARLEGGQLVFSGANGAPILRYIGLSATDADGKVLSSSLHLDGSTLTLRVNDRGARYPIAVDPLIQLGTVTTSDTAQGSEFGFRTAVSGSTLVVGAAGAFAGKPADTGAGAVYVFSEPASGWANATQVAKLTASNANPSSSLGASVAVGANAVYAIGSDTANDEEGLVYVYAKPAGGWHSETETAVLSQPGAAAFTQALAQVVVSPSASGDTVFAGAPDAGTFNGTLESYPGAVYVFKEPGGGWTSAASNEAASAVLTPSDAGGYLGSYLALSGHTLVAGAPYAGTQAQGAVYVFDDPTVTGTQTAELTAPDGASGALGYKVATDGSTIVAGAPFQTIGSNFGQGAAYVYTEPASGWATPPSPPAELTSSSGAAHDLFGLRVAVGVFPAGATSSASPTSQTPVETVFVGTGDGTGVYAFAEPPTGWHTTSDAALMGLSSASTYSLTLAGNDLFEGADESAHENTLTPAYLPGKVNVFDVPGGPSGPPVETSPPVITGSPKAGGKMTCSTGTWTNDPTVFTYQWSVDGTPIPGATSSTYTVQSGDEQLTLTCAVGAANEGWDAGRLQEGRDDAGPACRALPGGERKAEGRQARPAAARDDPRAGVARVRAQLDPRKEVRDLFLPDPSGVRVGIASPKLVKTFQGERNLSGHVVWASTSSSITP